MLFPKRWGSLKSTVKKYLDPNAEINPKYPKRSSKLDPFKPMIHEYLEDCVFNCEVIMERIVETGYEGKISILKEYVRPFRPPKKVPAVRRYETEPGRQAQMGWGICAYDDGQRMHKVPAFMIILGKSRTKYVEFTKRCDLFSLQRCILNALEYFGGVPETILTDNMKTVVERREAGKPIWNAAFLDFANDMGFVPNACRVSRPQTKGKVERLVQYVKGNFIPGRTFTDLSDLNRQALQWCDRINSKENRSTGKSAFDLLHEEPLHPLPDPLLRDRYHYESRIVSNDGFISYDGVRYGVPWEYNGRILTVRAINGKIEIFNGIDLVAAHKLEPHSGRTVFLEGQYKGLAEKNGIIIPAAALLDAKLDEAARNEDMTYLSFLHHLLEEEYEARKRGSQQTRLKLSKLPYRKTLEEFDFEFQPSIDREQINELGTLVFAERKDNVLFLGPPGVGKTHLAVGLALNAIENGKTVYFTSLTQMILDLEKTDMQGRLDRRWKVYMRPSILIIDEIGYYSLDRRAAESFFQIVYRI